MITREAVVLAGGFGTRLNSVVPDRPKPMAEINGRPFLEYLFDFLLNQGIQKIILSVGYRSEMIVRHFGNRYRNVPLSYAAETTPLGTGGGIRLALSMISGEQVFIVNGDTFFRISLTRMEDEFQKKEADVMLALHPVSNPERYGVVGRLENGRINTFTEKGMGNGPSLINGGIYLMKSSIFSGYDLPEAFSLEKDFLGKHAETLNIFGIPFNDDFIDIGIPETYHQAPLFFRNEEIAK